MLAIWGVWGAAAYDPSPVYEVFGAGEQSVNGFYVLLRRGEGGDSAVFARAYEKRASADAWLLAPSQLEWRRLNSGSASWIKQQRFAPRCFRPYTKRWKRWKRWYRMPSACSRGCPRTSPGRGSRQ